MPRPPCLPRGASCWCLCAICTQVVWRQLGSWSFADELWNQTWIMLWGYNELRHEIQIPFCFFFDILPIVSWNLAKYFRTFWSHRENFPSAFFCLHFSFILISPPPVFKYSRHKHAFCEKPLCSTVCRMGVPNFQRDQFCGLIFSWITAPKNEKEMLSSPPFMSIRLSPPPQTGHILKFGVRRGWKGWREHLGGGLRGWVQQGAEVWPAVHCRHGQRRCTLWLLSLPRCTSWVQGSNFPMKSNYKKEIMCRGRIIVVACSQNCLSE